MRADDETFVYGFLVDLGLVPGWGIAARIVAALGDVTVDAFEAHARRRLARGLKPEDCGIFLHLAGDLARAEMKRRALRRPPESPPVAEPPLAPGPEAMPEPLPEQVAASLAIEADYQRQCEEAVAEHVALLPPGAYDREIRREQERLRRRFRSYPLWSAATQRQLAEQVVRHDLGRRLMPTLAEFMVSTRSARAPPAQSSPDQSAATTAREETP